MLNRILLKALLLVMFLYFQAPCNARQLYTVADGDWFDASIWLNQLTPSGTYDTIWVINHLTINGYLVLAENDVLNVDSGASLWQHRYHRVI